MFGLSHRNYRDNLNAYIDGQLSPSDRARLEEHLQQCPECRWELETLQRTVALVRQMPVVRAPRSFQLPVQAPRPTPWLLRPWVYGTARVATVAATLVFVISLAGNVIVPEIGVRNAASAPPARGMLTAGATAPSADTSMAKSGQGTPAYQMSPEQPVAPTAAPVQPTATVAAPQTERAVASPTTDAPAGMGAAPSATPGAKAGAPQPTQVLANPQIAQTVPATAVGATPAATQDFFGSVSQGETTAATPGAHAENVDATATVAPSAVPAAVGTVRVAASPTATVLPTDKPTKTAVPTKTTAATKAAQSVTAPTVTVAPTKQADAAIAMVPGPVATAADGQNAGAAVSNDATEPSNAPLDERQPASGPAQALRAFAQATEGWPWPQLALASGSLLALLMVVLLYLKAMRARLS